MSKTCFIISSIGEEDSDTREIADTKYDLVFEPILLEFEYEVTRADKIGSPGSISYDIVKHLINSDLVIADVSDLNPNVFYELAIRNAINKPYILIKGPDQRLPFDIHDIRAISLDMADPRQWTSAKEKLKQHVKTALENQKNSSKSILTEFTFQINSDQTSEPKPGIDIHFKDLRNEVRSLRDELRRRPTSAFRSERLPYSRMNRLQKKRVEQFIEVMKKLRLEKQLPVDETRLISEFKTTSKTFTSLANKYLKRMVAAGVIDEVEPGFYNLVRDDYPDF